MKRKAYISPFSTTLILLALIPPALFAGGNREEIAPADSDTPVIFASIIPARFLIEEIGGERIIAETVVLPGESPATYEPSPRQMGRISRSPLLFRIGVAFENGFIPRLESVAPELKIFDLRQGVAIRMLEAPHSHDEAEEDHDFSDGTPDPHIWMSPRNMIIMAETVAKALIDLDPAGSAYYRKRAEQLIEGLKQLDVELDQALKADRGKRFFAYHPAFGYLADAYGLEQVPLEIEGKEPTARQLAAYIREAQEEEIRIIFVQPEFPRESANTVAEAIGGSVVPINPLAPDYIDNLKRTVEILKQGLE